MTEIPLAYGDPPQTHFTAQYRRLCQAAECATPQALADFLGIRQSAVSAARRSQVLPAAWLLTLLEKKGIDPRWVRLGQGERLARADAGHALSLERWAAVELGPAVACTTDELITELVRRALKNLS